MSKGKLAIIGVGEVPTGIYPERSHWDIIYDSCIEAIRDAGIDKNDVEGVISVAPQAQPRITAEMSFGKIPEELGLKGCKDVCMCNAGGTSTSNCIRLAEQWIHSGLAKFVLIPHVTIHSTIPIPEVVAFFATAGMDLQWEYPFGVTYNGMVAMEANRFMHDTGTTAEELASVVVADRKWAALDPNSIFYKKRIPTVEDILSSNMVSTPLHARECNKLADGGGAMVVTSAETAQKLGTPAAYKLGEDTTYHSACGTIRDNGALQTGFRDTSKGALIEAGITKEDIDLWNIYIAYPFAQLIALEGLGVCEPGQAGKFVKAGHTSPGGKCPVATFGDAAGRGHTGSGVSTAYYIETARQLMGKAGDRQVSDVKYVYQNTAGGSGMNMISTIWGNKIP